MTAVREIRGIGEKTEKLLKRLNIETVEELIPALDALLKEGDIVLVKASHFMRFDRIVEALK